MFERAHHQRIASVLERLDDRLLLKHQCLFGGGTAISLLRGEYRESVDIDFICSSIAGYREMRELVSQDGMSRVFRRPVAMVREPRIDQYGIRCAVGVDEVPIKLEIVFEGRVSLADPLPEDRLCGVWTMTLDDLVATKLMANADRWADDAVMSRDLIDLAMLVDGQALPPVGVEKARTAYGHSIDSSLEKSRAWLLDREGRLRLCMNRMGMQMAESELRAKVLGLSMPGPRRRRRATAP